MPDPSLVSTAPYAIAATSIVSSIAILGMIAGLGGCFVKYRKIRCLTAEDKLSKENKSSESISLLKSNDSTPPIAMCMIAVGFFLSGLCGSVNVIVLLWLILAVDFSFEAEMLLLGLLMGLPIFAGLVGLRIGLDIRGYVGTPLALMI